MDTLKDQDKLINYLADLEEKAVLTIVRDRLNQGGDPFEILAACQEGVRQVGERYQQGRYFIAGLIMAGEILQAVLKIIKPYLENASHNGALGSIVLGTVQGDIHDIGKNLAGILLSCQGFDVVDLGVDVTAEKFITAIKENRPGVVGLSCLLTTAIESMKEITAAIDAAGLRSGLPIIIGGSMIDAQACKFTGADYWTTDALDGVQWCRQMIEGKI